AEDGIRDRNVTGVQTCALPIYGATISIRCMRPRLFRSFGNGYGLGRDNLAGEARRLGADVIAVGTYHEVPEALRTFDGDVMVLRSEERRVGKGCRVQGGGMR